MSMPNLNLKKESSLGLAASKASQDAAKTKQSWELYLKPQQLLVMWSTLAGCLLVSFLFGYYAGRAEGIKATLRDLDSSKTAVRLPISKPIVSSSENNKLVAPSKIQTALNIAKDLKTPSVKPASNLKADIIKENSARGQFAIKAALPPAWYVQLSAVKTKSEAEAYWQKSASASMPIMVETAKTGSLEYFRILSGPFNTETQAQNQLDEIVKKDLSQGKAFVRKVN